MKKIKSIIIIGLVGLTFAASILTYFNRSALRSAFYIYQGEELNYKAGFVLRNQRASVEARRGAYRRSCEYFLKAYSLRPESFNYNRCEYAIDSCLWVEDFESVEKFRELQQNFKDIGGFKEADSPIYLW